MESNRQPCNIMVSPLVLDTLLEETLVELKKDPKYVNVFKLRTGKVGLVSNIKGEVFLLDAEGVLDINPLSGDDPVIVDVYANSGTPEGKESFTAFPVFEIRIPFTRAQEAASLDTVNLADFIRTFGSRLDSNYRTIKRFLEAGE